MQMPPRIFGGKELQIFYTFSRKVSCYWHKSQLVKEEIVWYKNIFSEFIHTGTVEQFIDCENYIVKFRNSSHFLPVFLEWKLWIRINLKQANSAELISLYSRHYPYRHLFITRCKENTLDVCARFCNATYVTWHIYFIPMVTLISCLTAYLSFVLHEHDVTLSDPLQYSIAASEP
jgi:hypothetical protein